MFAAIFVRFDRDVVRPFDGRERELPLRASRDFYVIFVPWSRIAASGVRASATKFPMRSFTLSRVEASSFVPAPNPTPTLSANTRSGK
jgi:hypothetical protein